MNELMRTVPPALPAAQGPYRAVGHEPPVAATIDLRRMVGTLARHRWHVIGMTCLVVVPVAIWTWTAQPMYRAATLLEIDPEPAQVLPYREVDRPGAAQFEMFLKGQDEILRGQTLQTRVSQRLAGDPDPRMAEEAGQVGGRLSVQGLANTYMFRVGYLAPSPDVAARVANIFAEEYIKQRFETRQQTRERARALLERELESLETRVQQSERGLVAYAQNNRLSIDEKAESPAHAQLSVIALQRTQAEAEVFAAQSKLSALEQAGIDQFPETLISPSISSLGGRLLQLENDLTSLQATFGPNWPAVVAKRQEVALVKDQLTREKRAALAQAVQQARLDLSVAASTQSMVVKRLGEQQSLVNDIENATVQYNIIRRDVDTNQKMYDGMLERLQQTSITSGMAFGGIQIVERAVPPGAVDSPRVAWNLALASVFGLALGMCMVVGRDYWDTSLSTVEELAHQTALPVLGAVPFFEGPGTGRRRLLRRRNGMAGELAIASPGTGAAPRVNRFTNASPAADAVRNVCTSILLSKSEHPPRVLMVTSPVAGEGKTTLARELAYAFGERGASTVLVECDLRRPKLAGMYGVDDASGLTPWLAGVTNTPPAVHELEDGLSIVVAGPQAPNPVVLLHSDRLRQFVTGLLASYRFVLLDAPPGLGVTDTRVLAPVTDGAVLVARSGKTHGPMLRALHTSLESAGITVLGTVLNAANPDLATTYLSEYYYG